MVSDGGGKCFTNRTSAAFSAASRPNVALSLIHILRYAVASQRAVGFYESLKDYNENASLWVAWFEGEKPADLAAFIQQEIEKAEASVEE